MNENTQNHELRPFEFSLSTISRIKPKHITEYETFDNMIYENRSQSTRNHHNISLIMNNLLKEDFKSNENFNLSTQEHKLIKTCQVVGQYIINSIENLEDKGNLVSNLYNQQSQYSTKADEIIQKQKDKINYLKMRSDNLNDNLLSLEFLLKQMKIDEKIGKLNKKAKINNINNKHKYKENHYEIDYSADNTDLNYKSDYNDQYKSDGEI